VATTAATTATAAMINKIEHNDIHTVATTAATTTTAAATVSDSNSGNGYSNSE